MLIDCDSCEVRGRACGDCVVTVLLGAPPDGVRLDAEERAALDVLAASGLVPPLRLVVAAEAAWRSADGDDHSDTGWDTGWDNGSDDGREDGIGYVVRYDTQRDRARDTG